MPPIGQSRTENQKVSNILAQGRRIQLAAKAEPAGNYRTSRSNCDHDSLSTKFESVDIGFFGPPTLVEVHRILSRICAFRRNLCIGIQYRPFEEEQYGQRPGETTHSESNRTDRLLMARATNWFSVGA